MVWNSPPEVDSDSAVKGLFYLLGIWSVGAGLVSLYAGLAGVEVFSLLGVGVYLWVAAGQLGVGLLVILAVYFRPRWFEFDTS